MEEIVVKLKKTLPVSQEGAAPTPADPTANRDIRIHVSARTLHRQKKRAEVWSEGQGMPAGSRFAMLCDEGVRIGGDDSAPPPLAYFSAGVAF
jgi:hypothetical protein